MKKYGGKDRAAKKGSHLQVWNMVYLILVWLSGKSFGWVDEDAKSIAL